MVTLQDIEAAQTNLTRAVQRYASSKSACQAMYGSTSILVVPQADYKTLADASWTARTARNRLGALQARRRAEIAALCRA